jgi:PAS domain S-box-containing protein
VFNREADAGPRTSSLTAASAGHGDAALNRTLARAPASAWLPVLGAATCVAVAYFLAARLGSELRLPGTHVSVVWLPNAILLSTLLLARRRNWWLYVAVLLPAHLLAMQPISEIAAIRAEIQFCANCATALLGALTLSAIVPDFRRFERVRTAAAFILVAGIFVPLVTSLLLAAALAVLDGTAAFWLTTAVRTLTNSFANLTIVPLVLHAAAWIRAGNHTIHVARTAEALLLATSVTILAYLGFLVPQSFGEHSLILLYAPFAPLLWAAVRFGVAGACALVLVLGIVALWAALNQIGPFMPQFGGPNVVSLLVLLAVTAMTMLMLPAALEERTALERADAISKARFSTVFEHHIMPTIIWNTDGRIVDGNASFFELTGYSRADVTRGDLITTELIRPVSIPGFTGPVMQPVNLNKDFGPVERELVVRDGTCIPVLVGGCRFPGRSNEGAAYVFDLSSLRRAEAGRNRAEMLHSAVLASIHDQIAVLDQSGVIIEANHSWRRFVEHSASRDFERASVGDHFIRTCSAAASVGDAVAGTLLRDVQDVLGELATRRRLEFSRETADGVLWQEICVERLHRPEGGAVITRTDISAQKQAMTEAREQKQQLAHLGRAAVLGELSGAFAHELAQPLTSILGNAEAALQLLPRTPELAEIHEILHDIIKDDVRAAEVIQRLRSMLARGEIQREPADLNQIVRDVLALARSDLVTRNVSVSLQLTPRLSRVSVDPIQIQQVILNLIVNSCEAMAELPIGERELRIETHAMAGHAECVVADRGRGIPAEQLERIFQPFVSSKKQGMGLGLAICRSIIEAHGGRLWAEDNRDRGAAFRFTTQAGL